MFHFNTYMHSFFNHVLPVIGQALFPTVREYQTLEKELVQPKQLFIETC